MNCRLPFHLFLFAFLLISPAQANSIKLIVEKADLAMKKEEWAAAEILLEKIVIWGRDRTHFPSSVYGPIYFKHGWCEFKQKKWTEAARSFERCYKKSPSKKNDVNPYHNLSLRYWAEAEYHLKNYEYSSRLFIKHFREKPSK